MQIEVKREASEFFENLMPMIEKHLPNVKDSISKYKEMNGD